MGMGVWFVQIFVRILGVLLAEVGGLTGGYVVEVYVGVGGDGVVYACLFTTGVGYLAPVGREAELLGAAEGQYGAFVGLALQYVGLWAYAAVEAEGAEEDVGYGLYVLVPVLVVHVVDDEARGEWQVGLFGLYAARGWDLAYGDDVGAVGREEEAFDVVGGAVLEWVATIGTDAPEVACMEVGYALCVAEGDVGGLARILAFGAEVVDGVAVEADDVDAATALVGMHYPPASS